MIFIMHHKPYILEEFPARCCGYSRGNIDGFGCKPLRNTDRFGCKPLKIRRVYAYDVGNPGTTEWCK